MSWMLSDGSQMAIGESVGRARVLQDGTLVIRNAQILDSGDYMCTASSSVGSAKSTSTVNVVGKEFRSTTDDFCLIDNFSSSHPERAYLSRYNGRRQRGATVSNWRNYHSKWLANGILLPSRRHSDARHPMESKRRSTDDVEQRGSRHDVVDERESGRIATDGRRSDNVRTIRVRSTKRFRQRFFVRRRNGCQSFCSHH